MSERNQHSTNEIWERNRRIRRRRAWILGGVTAGLVVTAGAVASHVGYHGPTPSLSSESKAVGRILHKGLVKEGLSNPPVKATNERYLDGAVVVQVGSKFQVVGSPFGKTPFAPQPQKPGMDRLPESVELIDPLVVGQGEDMKYVFSAGGRVLAAVAANSVVSIDTKTPGTPQTRAVTIGLYSTGSVEYLGTKAPIASVGAIGTLNHVQGATSRDFPDEFIPKKAA